ncbi:MAG: catalase, partial [Acetobacteraceae bacterium]|nr:catalase [Acetobacteraceae bacterium]
MAADQQTIADNSGAIGARGHESPAGLFAALHEAFGEHHARAGHAKGIVLEGVFTPAPEARELSSAALFAGAIVPVTVRFSDFPGIPDTADGANPRGLGVKFRLSDGSTLDVVAHGFNGFPVATADEFGTLLRLIGRSGPGAAKPTPARCGEGTAVVLARTVIQRRVPARLLVLGLLSFPILALPARAASPPGAAETPVLQQPLPNVPGSSLTAVVVDLPPGARSPRPAWGRGTLGYARARA